MAPCQFSSLTVEPIMFLCMKAFFLNAVAQPQIILENVCMRKYNNETQCTAMFTGLFKKEFDTVQQESTLWLGGIIIAETLLTILTLPAVSALSDVLGQRKLMILTPAFQIIQAVVSICILSRGIRFPTWLLFLAGPVPGVVGDVSALYVFAGTYIATITTLKQRTLRINLLEAASIVSGLTATISSGFIISRFGYIGIYAVNLTLLLLAIAYLAFCLKPTDPIMEPVTRRNFSLVDLKEDAEEEARPASSSMQIVEDLKKTEETNANHTVVGTCKLQETDGGDTALADCQSLMEKDNGNNSDRSSHQALHYSYLYQQEQKLKKGEMNANDKTQTEMPEQIRLHSDHPVEASPVEASPVEAMTALKIFHIIVKSNPIGNLKRVYKVLKESGQLRYGTTLFLLVAFSAFSYSGELAILVLYLKNHPLLLNTKQIGYFLAFMSGSLSILGLVFFNYLCAKIFKLNDYVMLLLTSFSHMLYFLLLGFSGSLLMLYLIQIVHAVATLNTPIVRSMLTKTVHHSTMGLLLGALITIEASAGLLGSIVSPAVYSRLAATKPGAAFFVGAAIMFASLCVSFHLFMKQSRMNKGKETGRFLPEKEEGDA